MRMTELPSTPSLSLLLAVGDDGNAVGNDVDLRGVDAVHAVEERGAVAAHDDEALGEADERVHHRALHRVGLREDGVERRDDRHAQLAQELEDVAAGLAAEDAVLVLHGHDVDRVDVEEVGGAPVGGDVALGDLEADPRRIRVLLRRRRSSRARSSRAPASRARWRRSDRW